MGVRATLNIVINNGLASESQWLFASVRGDSNESGKEQHPVEELLGYDQASTGIRFHYRAHFFVGPGVDSLGLYEVRLRVTCHAFIPLDTGHSSGYKGCSIQRLLFPALYDRLLDITIRKVPAASTRVSGLSS